METWTKVVPTNMRGQREIELTNMYITELVKSVQGYHKQFNYTIRKSAVILNYLLQC